MSLSMKMLKKLLKPIASRFVQSDLIYRLMGVEKRCSNRLAQIGNYLQHAGRSSETEFLALGEQLQSFSSRSADIARTCSSIADKFSGPEVSGAIQVSRDIFVGIKDLEDRSGHGTTILGDILESISILLTHLQQFRRIVMFLRVLCISTKVESAKVRDEENEFGLLGENVGKMIQEVEFHQGQLMALSESLRRFLRETIENTSSLDRTLSKQARIIMEGTLSNLQVLTEKHEQSSKTATEIKARFEDISHSIGGIITSMQIHDITRQRMEHSASSLLGLTDEMNHMPKAAVKAGRGINPLAFLRRKMWPASESRLAVSGRVSMLQKEQLHRASVQLVEAVENIIENMNGISSLISEVVENSKELAGATGGAGTTFLEAIENGILSIESAFSGYAQAKNEMNAAVTSVGAALKDMRSFADEIQGIGFKMKLVGLNALVKAAHMNEEGTALGVLAEDIHHVSKESVQCIESVHEVLSSIGAAAAKINLEAGAAGSEKALELDAMATELKGRIAGLRKTGEIASSLLKGANSGAQALSGEICKTAAGVKVHRQVADAIHSTIIELDEIAELYPATLPEEAASGMGGYLESLEEAYTMQDQRHVHQAVMMGASQGDRREMESIGQLSPLAREDTALQAMNCSVADQGNSEDDGSEFGDNVELF